VVTRESFISICWRLIPYWLNNWEQQWGAECSSMMVSNASAHQMHAHSPHTCKVLHSKQRRDTAADLWSCLHATLAMLGVLASML
jgi:hypothetical protein